jgi:hypothetical protein
MKIQFSAVLRTGVCGQFYKTRPNVEIPCILKVSIHKITPFQFQILLFLLSLCRFVTVAGSLC